MAKKYVAGVLDGAPWLDDLVLLDRAGTWRQRWAAARRLRGEQFELAVLFANTLRSALTAWLAGCKRRIGFVRHGRRLLLTDPLYYARTPSPIIDDYNRLAECAGCPPPGHCMELFTTAADEQAADAVWTRFHLDAAPEVVCLNPGAAFGASKLWPAQSFARLAQHLVDWRDAKVLVLCGPAERELADEIVARAARPDVCSIADEPLSLGLTKALVRRATLLVTTDSGPRHFAAAFDRPVVTLFGPTHIAWTETYFAPRDPFAKGGAVRAVPEARLPDRSRLHAAAGARGGVCRRGQSVVPPSPAAKGVVMAYLEIAPRYRAVLSAHGYASARAFLDWAGVILSGHRGRHVLRVRAGAASFILKKEHRVPLRDRLASAWAGYGWSSKSAREARLLQQLRAAGVPCPQVVAAGEDGSQAFLLMREQTGMAELRELLARPLGAADRRALAQALGRELAHIHAAGFTQPDLSAKHILVRSAPDGFHFCFLDWQRSRPRRRVSWRRRVRDLATLDASLAAELVPDRLRLVCLRAYVQDTRAHGVLPPRSLAVAIRRVGERRRLRRKMRELRQPPLPAGAQQLLWLRDGERLCIVRDFFEELGGQLPSWLPQEPAPCAEGMCVEHRLILLGSGRTAHLVQRWTRTASWLPQGKYPAREFAQAALLFRLQRFGVAGPRLLAMGHHQIAAWQRFSFLLSEPPTGPSLAAVLRQDGTALLRQRLLRRLGSQLRQLHEAGFTLGPAPTCGRCGWCPIRRCRAWRWPTSRRSSAHGAPWQRLAAADLWKVMAAYPQAGLALSRTDRLRVLLGYLQRRRLDGRSRRLLGSVVPRERRVA